MATWIGRKLVKKENPHEIWESLDGTWVYKVLQKHQKDDDKPYARWFCYVTSPMTYGGGDMGDCYVTQVKLGNILVERDGVRL